jgi:glutathione S-transferase
MITIHNFPGGARGIRAMWVCEEMKLAYRTEALSYPTSTAYRALNPLGTAPLLEDQGHVIGESVAMMLYLAERYGPTPLLPGKDDPALARVLQFTVFGEATLGAGMNPLLMTRFGAPDTERNNWLAKALEPRVAQAVDVIAREMDGRQYLVGDVFTLADISVSTALDMWKGGLGKEVPEALAPWRARLAERPAYQRAQKAQQRQA